MGNDVTSRLFCRLDGVDYYDWTIRWSKYNYRTYANDGIAVGRGILDKIADVDEMLDDTFALTSGSEIHVVPSCPIGMADIRKNYVTKRKVDDGCCNVFSPFKGSTTWMACAMYAIVPSRKTFILQEGGWPRDNNKTRMNLECVISNTFPDLSAEEREQIIYKEGDSMAFVYGNIPMAYVDLFFGKLKKPCVSYKKLEFKTDNQVSLDILYLVYRAGMSKAYTDAIEKFKIQLCALNEHNWRDYPGTISMLFKNLLNPRSSSKCSGELYAVSRMPKAAKELVISMTRPETIPFKSQEDIDMAQRLLIYVLEMPENLRFSTMETIISKLQEKHISIDCFCRCFNNMVKITPKEFKNES